MRLFILLLSCLLSLDLAAQVQLGVTTERDNYLRYEPVTGKITIVNNSGVQLRFDKNNPGARLRLVLINEQQQLIEPFKDDFNPIAGLVLAAGETRSLELNINEHYPMSATGKYSLTAELAHPAFALKFASDKCPLEISPGISIAKRPFGMTYPLDTRKVVQRYYELLVFKPAAGGADILCLKIADDKFVYGLHRLGPHVNGVNIGHDVDGFSSIHTLIQVKASLFVHSVFSPSGEMKQIVAYSASFQDFPALRRDPSLGKISVEGGVKLTEGVDYRRDGNMITLTPRADAAAP
jgi:hypothetical protein